MRMGIIEGLDFNISSLHDGRCWDANSVNELINEIAKKKLIFFNSCPFLTSEYVSYCLNDCLWSSKTTNFSLKRMRHMLGDSDVAMSPTGDDKATCIIVLRIIPETWATNIKHMIRISIWSLASLFYDMTANIETL